MLISICDFIYICVAHEVANNFVTVLCLECQRYAKYSKVNCESAQDLTSVTNTLCHQHQEEDNLFNLFMMLN